MRGARNTAKATKPAKVVDMSRILLGGSTAVVIFALSLLTGYITTTVYLDSYVNDEVAAVSFKRTRTARILVLGDMMFDRSVRTLMHEKGLQYPFAGTKEMLQTYDLVAANLEGPITTHASVALPGEKQLLQFTFQPEVATLLAQNNVKLVSLANNHTHNFGADGLAQTRAYLKKAGVNYFGDPLNVNHYGTVETINGIKVAFVGYHDFAHGVERVTKAIADVRPHADYVIVMPHWGNEYEHAPSARQIRIAHEFIDAGADIIIGAHPHVRQEREVYKGKTIYYSVGNFIFDQWWNTDVRCGEGIELLLTKRGSERKISENVHTFYSSRAQPTLDTSGTCVSLSV